MKKRWLYGLGIAAALLIAQTVVWEYARMRPDYGFIVDPWSIRGYETVHGAIAVAAGVLALLALLAVIWKGSEQPRYGILITACIVVGATGIAAVFGDGDYTLTPGFPVIALLTLIIGVVAFRLIGSIAKNSALYQRFWFRQLLLLGLLVVTGFVINASIGGKEIMLPQWAAIGIVFVLIAALSIAAEPRELAANRMLMFSSLVGAAVLTMSAGAVRSTLLRFQIEVGGVPAQYKDTQVTSGHLMAVFGMALVFLVAVALWARRRDAILTAQRAQRQRDAAEASAAEIEAALQQVGSA